jgi:hypothetical protein
MTDISFSGTNWHSACQNPVIFPNGQRPSKTNSVLVKSCSPSDDLYFLALKFELLLEATIQGLVGTHAVSAQVSNANCPFELPSNSA